MKILWVKSELLHPVDKGGKIRTYQMLKHLKQKHDVTYIALANPRTHRESIRRADEYCHRVITVPWLEAPRFSARFYKDLVMNLSSPLPYAIQKYRSNQMRREIERELHATSYDAVVCDFLVPSVNLPVRGGRATILFQHNVESIIWRRHYETQTSAIRRAYFHSQWEKMFAYEREACRRFDAVVAVSDVDRDFIRDHYGVAAVHDVPTGVDIDYFQPMEIARDENELVFTGSMDWMPNEDAVFHFAEEVLPRVASAIPEVKLTVAGRNPTARLRALARADNRIRITGRVDDIRPYIARAAAYVVPIRVGGGTRLKIYEAMAMGMPVVSTSIGAEGLPVRHAEELLIANSPDRFARAVIRLLKDREFADGIGERGRMAVSRRFGWERAAAVFAEICEDAASNRTRSRVA